MLTAPEMDIVEDAPHLKCDLRSWNGLKVCAIGSQAGKKDWPIGRSKRNRTAEMPSLFLCSFHLSFQGSTAICDR